MVDQMKNISRLLGITIVIFLFGNEATLAQKAPVKHDVIRNGLFRSQMTIAPGVMLGSKLTNIYLHGGFEYFLGRKVSFVGQGYWFINSQQKNQWLKHNSSVLWGLRYHFPYRKLDTYIGLEPGLGLVQARQTDGESLSLLKVTPLISATTGITYYLGRFFNFFLEARYVHGQHSTAWSKTYKLDEFRFSAGLGWNVNFIRKKS